MLRVNLVWAFWPDRVAQELFGADWPLEPPGAALDALRSRLVHRKAMVHGQLWLKALLNRLQVCLLEPVDRVNMHSPRSNRRSSLPSQSRMTVPLYNM